MVANVAYLVLASRQSALQRPIPLVAAAGSCLATLLLGVLSWLEHGHSRRPSILITLYLSFNVLLNLAISRTLWLTGLPLALPIFFTLAICFKTVSLALENVEKSRLLSSLLAPPSPEELAGPFSRNTFGWLLSLLKRGYQTMLAIPQLTPLSTDLKGPALEKTLGEQANLWFYPP